MISKVTKSVRRVALATFIVIVVVASGSSQTRIASNRSEAAMIKTHEPKTIQFFKDVFDELFVRRDSLKTFSTYAACDSLDQLDLEVTDGQGCFGERPLNVTAHDEIRHYAFAWQFEVGHIYLGLGLYPLDDVSRSATSEYERLFAEVAKSSQIAYRNVDLTGLNRFEAHKKLDEIQKLLDELNDRVSAKINSDVYAKNIVALRKSNRIAKRTFRGRMYYIYSIEKLEPSLYLLATVKKGKLKLIHIGDNA